MRADRQPEFTQVDMELSFVDQEDILQHLEQLFRYLFRETMGITFPAAFPRITWQEAMERYGSDKPDLRFGLPITDITDIALKCDFSVFRQAAEKGGAVRAINVKGCADFSRSTIEDLTQKAMHYGAGGMAWIAIRPDGELYSVLTKYFSKEEMDELLCRIAGEPGDFILFCADKPAAVCRILGNLRLDLGDLLKLRPKDRFAFVVVTDFPLFEYSEEEGRYVAAHHPFTMPYPEDIPRMRTDPASVRAQAYDIVLNGVELGSGSIRIHRPDIQQLMFEVLGFTEDEIRERFGFLINAFRYGTPPHGGFAFGLDRLVMLMRGADSLRDVIAFPKMKDASCPLTGAPDFVDREQLEILRLLQNEADGMQAGTASRQHKTRPAVSAEKVANLAKLKLSEQERGAIESELNRIIAFADQLSEIPTAEIPITAHVAPMKNVWRADAVQPPFDRDLLLSSTPKKENGFVVM